MTTTPEPEDLFTVPEEDVARRTGLALDEVRDRRGSRGIDFAQKGRGHRYWWTEAAVEALANALGASVGSPELPGGSPVPTGEESAGTAPLLPAAEPPCVVVLTRTTLPNHRVVVGKVGGEGEDVIVAVGHGKALLFVPGMRVRARHRQGRLYAYEGNPDRPDGGRTWPRARGRW